MYYRMLEYNINAKYIYSLNQVPGLGNLIQEKSYVSMLNMESSNYLMMTHPRLMVDGAHIA
jgi:hypothetical protein